MEPSPEAKGSVTSGKEQSGKEDVAKPKSELLPPCERLFNFLNFCFFLLEKYRVGMLDLLLHDGDSGIHDRQLVHDDFAFVSFTLTRQLAYVVDDDTLADYFT